MGLKTITLDIVATEQFSLLDLPKTASVRPEGPPESRPDQFQQAEVARKITRNNRINIWRPSARSRQYFDS